MSEGATSVRWLLKDLVVAIHDLLVREHGGAAGLREEGLLESALARPMQLLHYEPEATLARLAAAYGAGIAGNHPFVDGNKRVAFMAAAVFLEINGRRLVASESEAARVFVDLAAGKVTEPELAAWLEQNLAAE